MQFGGQTPLKLAPALEAAGVPLLGTSPEAIDLAEDRGRFGALLDALGLKAPPYATAHGAREALAVAPRVGFPLLVRPSYVLGGRAMELVYSDRGAGGLPGRRTAPTASARSSSTASWRTRSRSTSTRSATARTSDRRRSCSTSRRRASTRATRPACCRRTRSAARCSRDPGGDARDRASTLGVVGLMNVQYGVRGDDLYVIEANPRASRTVPFVSKATGPAAGQARLPGDARGAAGGLELPASPCGDTCRSRRRCCRSTASPAPTRCSGRRCARRAR